jgi:hypothetical protein
MSAGELLVDAMAFLPAGLVLVYEWVRYRRWGRGITSAVHSWLIAVIGIQALVRIGPAAAVPGIAGNSGADALRFDPSLDAVARLFLFALWLGLGARYLVATRGQDRLSLATRGPRTATLHSRAGSSSVTHGAWAFVFAIWTNGVVVVSVGTAMIGRGIPTSNATVAVALTLVSLALAVCAPAAVRAVERDPEPLDPLASYRLANEYAVHRHAKCAGYYWLTLAVVTWVSLAVSAALLTESLASPLGYALEASAFAIGIVGSAFGIRLVEGRSRIRGLLDGLRTEATPA